MSDDLPMSPARFPIVGLNFFLLAATSQCDPSMRYNTRAILVLQAWLAVAVAAVLAGVAHLGDFLGMMLGVLILAPLVGAGLAVLIGIPRRYRKGVAIFVAAAVGIGAGVFVAMQVEWASDGPEKGHPWPESDEWFVALAGVRGGLLGGLIGYIVLKTLSLASRSAQQREKTVPAEPASAADANGLPSVLRRARGAVMRPNRLAVGVVVLLTAVSWSPYLSFHLESRAVRQLVATVEAGKMDQLPSRVATVKKYRNGEGAISGIAYRATKGQDAQVRLAALEALKLLGDTASGSPLLPLVLAELELGDSDERVRSVAKNWSETLKSEAGPLVP